MTYRMKAVFFDTLDDCAELKESLKKAQIAVIPAFFGIHGKEMLYRELEKGGFLPEECLFLTGQEAHAREAKEIGLVVIGCVEGHFEVPRTSVLLENPGEISLSCLNRYYCHERKVPAVLFETSRLRVQELTGQDMDALYELLTEEEVGRYLPVKPGSRKEELEKLISYVECVYPFFEYGYWGVFLKKTGELIGRAGFREGSEPPEAGYVIKKNERRKGYGTEVLRGLISYASEEILCEELCVFIDRRNLASVRVAEKCGFVRVGEKDVLKYRYTM
ncbi:MAG: GNAT family N-acetyltransferase [Lachnospiraceae bacterium]|nr:GNAT family N-acetyltransferase [Lachnospiraceae bacterium]